MEDARHKLTRMLVRLALIVAASVLLWHEFGWTVAIAYFLLAGLISDALGDIDRLREEVRR